MVITVLVGTNCKNSFVHSQTDDDKFEKYEGVVDLVESENFQIFNKDGSVWCNYSYKKAKCLDGKNSDVEILPFAYHPDYYLLKFIMTRKSDKFIEIVVNEKSGLKKYIDKNLAGMKTETWKEHILNLFAVDVNKNQLYDKPNGIKIKSFPSAVVETKPVEVNGDWLKVRFKVKEDYKTSVPITKEVEEAAGKFAWVKWRQNGKVLIEFFYFA